MSVAKSSKPSKKDVHLTHFNFNDHEDYKNYADYIRHESSKKPRQLSSQARKPTKSAASVSKGNLPIGMAYFDENNQKNVFAPITFAPVPMHQFHRSYNEGIAPSNIQLKNRNYQMLEGEEEPIQMQSVHNMQTHAEPNYMNFDNIAQEEERIPEEAKAYLDLVPMPEMYKFTLDDVVLRPRETRIINPFEGPVTMAPPPSLDEFPSSLDLNTAHIHVNDLAMENPESLMKHFPMSTISSQNLPDENEMQPFGIRSNKNNERYSFPKTSYRKVERERFFNPIGSSSRLIARQFRKFDSNPTPTTIDITPSTEASSNDEVQIRAAIESWTPTPQLRSKNSKRTRADYRKLHQQMENVKNQAENSKTEPRHQHLEVSRSYTKQRTQGYNSIEDVSTTPMTSLGSKRNGKKSKPYTDLKYEDYETPIITAETQTHAKTADPIEAKYYQ